MLKEKVWIMPRRPFLKPGWPGRDAIVKTDREALERLKRAFEEHGEESQGPLSKILEKYGIDDE